MAPKNEPAIHVYKPGAPTPLANVKSFLGSRGYTDRWLSAPDSYLVTAEGHAGLCGCGVATVEAASAVLMSFVVDEKDRGRGIGTKMVESVLRELSSEGVQVVFLFSRKSGDFWKRLGFSPVPVEQVAVAAAGHFQVKAFLADGSLWTDRAFLLNLSPVH